MQTITLCTKFFTPNKQNNTCICITLKKATLNTTNSFCAENDMASNCVYQRHFTMELQPYTTVQVRKHK